MIVWMSTLRRGLTYHHRMPGQRQTICGRFVGDPGSPPERGYVLGEIEALDVYGARECSACAGSYDRVKPPVVRSGRP